MQKVFFKKMKRVDAGSYNVILLDMRKKVIFRLGMVNIKTHPTGIRDKERAVGIMNFFLDNPELRSSLGPCIVRTVSKNVKRLHKVPAEFLAVLKLPDDSKFLTPLPANSIFTLSYMEALWTFDSFLQQNLNRHMFMLTWFLVTAQHTCNFVHRDIKPSNICFRKFDPATGAKTYAFDLFDGAGEGKFVLKNVACVPVLIDYDFASIHLTLPANRKKTAGSLLYMSPDILSRTETRLQSITQAELLREDLSSDWFALGMTFLMLTLVGTTDLIQDKDEFMFLTEYVIRRRGKLPFGHPNIVERTLFEQFLWVTRVAKAENALPPGFSSSARIKLMIDQYGYDGVVVRNCKTLRRSFKRNTTPRVREMIQNMLSWDTEKRLMNGGAVYRYLEFFMDDFYETDLETVGKIDESFGLFSSLLSTSSYMLDPGEEDKGVLIPDDGDLQKFAEIRSQILL